MVAACCCKWYFYLAIDALHCLNSLIHSEAEEVTRCHAWPTYTVADFGTIRLEICFSLFVYNLVCVVQGRRLKSPKSIAFL